MHNCVQTYVLHDSDAEVRKREGAMRIRREEALDWQKRGYGIFHTVQIFYGPRQLSKLEGINAWAVDIDKGSKEEMLARIQKGLVPTTLVETKRGYHVYWKAKDATRENWREININRLVPFYDADKNAKDLARILRTPGYYHLKDPANPFLVKIVSYHHVEYTEREMFQFYKDLETPKKQKKLHRQTQKQHPGQGSFWENVWNLDCQHALEVLSGSAHVGGEVYDFRQNSSGSRQIYVNGKSSSCWIDQEGRIGSMDEGGPTIAQWLNWFHKDYSKVVQIIKEVFPECQTQQQMPLL